MQNMSRQQLIEQCRNLRRGTRGAFAGLRDERYANARLRVLLHQVQAQANPTASIPMATITHGIAEAMCEVLRTQQPEGQCIICMEPLNGSAETPALKMCVCPTTKHAMCLKCVHTWSETRRRNSPAADAILNTLPEEKREAWTRTEGDQLPDDAGFPANLEMQCPICKIGMCNRGLWSHFHNVKAEKEVNMKMSLEVDVSSLSNDEQQRAAGSLIVNFLSGLECSTVLNEQQEPVRVDIGGAKTFQTKEVWKKFKGEFNRDSKKWEVPVDQMCDGILKDWMLGKITNAQLDNECRGFELQTEMMFPTDLRVAPEAPPAAAAAPVAVDVSTQVEAEVHEMEVQTEDCEIGMKRARSEDEEEPAHRVPKLEGAVRAKRVKVERSHGEIHYTETRGVRGEIIITLDD